MAKRSTWPSIAAAVICMAVASRAMVSIPAWPGAAESSSLGGRQSAATTSLFVELRGSRVERAAGPALSLSGPNRQP